MKKSQLLAVLGLLFSQEAHGAEEKHRVGHEDELLLQRIEDALTEWNPDNLQSPYLVRTGFVNGRPTYALRRPDLAQFIADPDAAIQLGKALFWEMRAGSDFKPDTSGIKVKAQGMACASCHYQFGVDHRTRGTDALAFQAWNLFAQDRDLSGETDDTMGRPPFTRWALNYEPGRTVAEGWFSRDTLNVPGRRQQGLQSHRVIGSLGITLKAFNGIANGVEKAQDISQEADDTHRRSDMFALYQNGKIAERLRQVTQRNSPSVINAVFNDRQFHDGRAESTFNGFSIFGDYDDREILKKADLDGAGASKTIRSVKIAIPNASLASQAVGPIVNEVEMSYLGRSLHDIGSKLIDSKPLEYQPFADDDSVLGGGEFSGAAHYRDLIKKAFRREWWQCPPDFQAEEDYFTPLNKFAEGRESVLKTEMPQADDRLMVNNFGLYWGLSIMLYQSTLVSNQSPFDQMLQGDSAGVEAVWKNLEIQGVVFTPDGSTVQPPEPNIEVVKSDRIVRRAQLDKRPNLDSPPVLNATGMFQRGLRVFVRNCSECHQPPLFTSAGELLLDPGIPQPIAALHSHALVRPALADAFKEKLIGSGQAHVDDGNRHLLGGRRYFNDEERLPVVEELMGPLMIESMLVDSDRPTSFNLPPAPGNVELDRQPMIAWKGTRRPFEFAATGPPVDPYAFYDLGFYNIGVSEPRYDWGVWNMALPAGLAHRVGVPFGKDKANVTLSLERKAEGLGFGALGSAYSLPLDQAATKALHDELKRNFDPGKLPDESENRAYSIPGTKRKDHRYFGRSRRMVMSEQTWGHRKPFISDSELMGWGAFKTPSLRNIALTAPYMHNGRFLTLRQVLHFYSFDNPDLIPANVDRNPDLHPEMGRLELNADGKVVNAQGVPGGLVDVKQVQDAEALLFFMHCLTDSRVTRREAPFDHPAIRITDGQDLSTGKPHDLFREIDLVGSKGSATPSTFLSKP